MEARRYSARRPFVLLVRVTGIDRVRGSRHRAVEVHVQPRNLAARLELADEEQQLLRASHRERRDEQDASSIHGPLHRLGEDGPAVVVRMETIAVGRFDDERVGLAHGIGIPHHRYAVAAEVAGVHEAPPRRRHLHHRGAENVPGE